MFLLGLMLRIVTGLTGFVLVQWVIVILIHLGRGLVWGWRKAKYQKEREQRQADLLRKTEKALKEKGFAPLERFDIAERNLITKVRSFVYHKVKRQ